MENNESALKKQVGGNHYKKLAIQPMEYAMKNHLDPLQFSIVKYVTRFRDKDGKTDLKKARHCLDMLIEVEYGKQTENELQLMSELPKEWQKLFLYTKEGECKLGLRLGRVYYVLEINKQDDEFISSIVQVWDGKDFVGWRYADVK